VRKLGLLETATLVFTALLFMLKNLLRLPVVNPEAVNNYNRYISEFISSFALVFCGTGAIVINELTGAVTHAGVAVTFGSIVMVMIYALGPVSGSHMNPAVTISFAVGGRFRWNLVLPYIISQILGAFAASFTLKLLFPQSQTLGASLPSGTALQSFILEFILSLILMLVILRVASGSKEQGLFAGLAIGATVMLEAMFAGPICGASMNPARSLAPAFVSGHTEHFWIYILAPIAGTLSALLLFKLLQKSTSEDHPVQ
jgi:aquaporin Z